MLRLNILRIPCFVVIVYVASIVFSISYAEGFQIQITVPCKPPGQENSGCTIIGPGEDWQLAVRLDGLQVDGYEGLIKREMPAAERVLLDDAAVTLPGSCNIDVTAQCGGTIPQRLTTNPNRNLGENDTLQCLEGASVRIVLTQPLCSNTIPDPVNNPDKRAIFTVTVTQNKKETSTNDTAKECQSSDRRMGVDATSGGQTGAVQEGGGEGCEVM